MTEILFLSSIVLITFLYAVIHRGGEGKHIYPGLNYYPWVERNTSIGFKLKFTNHQFFAIRWATARKTLHIWYSNLKEEDKSWARSWSL